MRNDAETHSIMDSRLIEKHIQLLCGYLETGIKNNLCDLAEQVFN